MKYQLKASDEFVSSLANMSLEELNTLQQKLTKERHELKAKARAVAELRHKLSAEEDAGTHGLTVEEYKQVKISAKENGVTLSKAITLARRGVAKARSLQSVKTKPVDTSAESIKA